MLRFAGCVCIAALSGCVSESGILDREGYDRWFQVPTDKVDILWVIDDSSSMDDEQALLSEGIANFTEQLEASGADFQIGVATTSFGQNAGILVGDPPYLTVDDDYRSELPTRTRVGVRGSDMEKGLAAAVRAVDPQLTDGGANDGFIRPDANLLVAIVSDEDDCSDDGALQGGRPTDCIVEDDKLVPVVDYVSDLWALKDRATDVQIAAIVGTRDSACTANIPAYRYVEAAALTDGLVGDICEPEWSALLDELGLNALGIRTRFNLTSPAFVDDLVVIVDGEQVEPSGSNGWTYHEERCELSFHGTAIPDREAQITAAYTIASGASCAAD